MTCCGAGCVSAFTAGAVFLAGPVVAVAGPPEVVRTAPALGAEAVDPTLVTAVRVEFDQPMSRGSHSWVGGGDTFPKLRGQPYWEGDRIAVLPVRFEPNRTYRLGLNSRSFRNFQSARGQPLEPVPFEFKTGAASAMTAETLADLNRRSVDEVRRLVAEEYSYHDLRGVDWDEAFRKHAPDLASAEDARQFAERLAKLLGLAKDIHITVSVGDFHIGTHRSHAVPNYDLALLKRIVPDWKWQNDTVATGWFDDGIGYVLIASWGAARERDLDAAQAAIRRFEDAPGVIIDVRPNSGGDERLAQNFAGMLVKQPRAYARQVYRNVYRPGGFTQSTTRVLQPADDPPDLSGRIAVLMGPANMSSCEAFLLMMRQVPNCRLFGERSYGASGNPGETELSNGVVVSLPRWKAMTPDGDSFEGVGIEPDVKVHVSTDRPGRADPVLDAGLSWLRTRR